jgi:hypothetical protein
MRRPVGSAKLLAAAMFSAHAIPDPQSWGFLNTDGLYSD